MIAKYKLICFDVDGTLTQNYQEKFGYWENIHEHVGAERGKEHNAHNNELFKQGKLSYKEWTLADFRMFKEQGVTEKEFVAAAYKQPLRPHAKELIRELKRRGYKLAIISGGINTHIETLFPDHQFDDIYNNKIHFDDEGNITHWEDTVYDAGTKHKALQDICKREGIDLAHTVFVGDGENDIDILKEAGLGIAFCPKSDAVRAAADVVIEEPDLLKILNYLV